jgi:hypothetical protein
MEQRIFLDIHREPVPLNGAPATVNAHHESSAQYASTKKSGQDSWPWSAQSKASKTVCAHTFRVSRDTTKQDLERKRRGRTCLGLHWDHSMKTRILTVLVLSLIPVIAFADTTVWRKYAIPSTGANVDIPVSIFTEDAGPSEGGTGRRFFTKDHRADLTLQSIPNPENDSPSEFLQNRRPPADIQYKRVTPRFFAVSSVRNGRTWYNRCNRAEGYMNCVLINYPAAEERLWDAVVTRISLSLVQ